MKEILKRVLKEGLILDVKDGKLQIFSTKDQVDESLIAEIKSKSVELVEYLNKHKKSKVRSKTYEQIPLVNQQEDYPISHAQLSLWLASQLEERSIAYNIPNSIVLEGDYDLESFQNAIYAVVDRHEILRTVFPVNDSGEVRQRVLPAKALDFKIQYFDFTKEEDVELASKQFVEEASSQPFDLLNGPLLKASLLKIASDKYIFFYNLHHIISDEWSMNVLANEVMIYYNAFLTKNEPELPPLSIQYKDYAAWQLNQINDDSYQTHRAYWLKKLENYETLLDLPTTKIRPSIKTYQGRSIGAKFSPEITTHLRSFVQNHEGSLFSGLLAVWKILLYHYTNEKDIIIGNPVVNREHPDLENQIGFYLNTLPLRTQINPQHSFATIYGLVRETISNAQSHQIYPFEKIVEDLEVPRNHSRSPFFDVLVDYHGSSKAETQATPNGELEFLGEGLVKFDLELHLLEETDGVGYLIRYNSDVYEEATISNLAKHYQSLAESLLNQPEKPIGEVNFLTPQEHTLIASFNQVEAKVDINQTVLDLLAEQVKTTPKTIALRFRDLELTYQEIEEKSNRLANCLISDYGVKPGAFVGIHMDRSEIYIIGLIGILKSGGIFVPIDTQYPADRKKYLIQDAGIRVLLSDTTYMFDMTDYYEGVIFAMDVEYDESKYDKLFSPKVKPEDLAYLIYTSGSSGKPKGVLVGHQGLTNYLTWGRNYYLQSQLSNTNFGFFTSPSFDLTITSLFLPLISGGTVHVFEEKQNLIALLEEYLMSELSCIKLTPSHISLLDGVELKGSHLELAVVGGEELTNQHVEILRKINPAIKIYNEYGPTEATVGCTVYQVRDLEQPINIGRPIQNMEIQLLNPYRQLTPIGLLGEIYIGGEGLAHGYLNQPDLTEEKFVPHPFKPGKKLYRTGDIGVWLADGDIDFKGRIDEQVKIRGYRIELEEIENTLNQLASIKRSVVAVKLAPNNSKHLVAYLVTEDGSLHADAVLEALEQKLPNYMVPKIYIPLTELPLTPNGKLDRDALPVPMETAFNQKSFVEPNTQTEKELAEIWQQILNMDKISIVDNFFELGGHSLLATKLAFAISKHWDTKIEINTVFVYPTIKLQAQYLDVISPDSHEKSENEDILYV